ncbi:MAG: hypothetical protein CFK52_07735 [Chloracidobacterium sp. CP2_5A]|nr:MAG: hypothetical protein CFK52_07735 [Chloracidobacterium sp. CP2_5A]
MSLTGGGRPRLGAPRRSAACAPAERAGAYIFSTFLARFFRPLSATLGDGGAAVPPGLFSSTLFRIKPQAGKKADLVI